MKTTTTVLAVTALLFFAGCSKHECEDSAPAPQDQGNVKIPNVFVYVADAGVAVPNYQLTVHCGPTLSTNGSGRLMFNSGGCTTTSEVNGGNHCFQRNTYYWLVPPGTSNNRMYLRFKFSNAFDFTSLSSAMVRYEPSSFTWTVPNAITGFEWVLQDTRKTLPACQALSRL